MSAPVNVPAIAPEMAVPVMAPKAFQSRGFPSSFMLIISPKPPANPPATPPHTGMAAGPAGKRTRQSAENATVRARVERPTTNFGQKAAHQSAQLPVVPKSAVGTTIRMLLPSMWMLPSKSMSSDCGVRSSTPVLS